MRFGLGSVRWRRGWFGLAGLAVALVAGAVLLWQGPAKPPAAAGPLTLERVWPAAKPVTYPGQLPDGTGYLPLHQLDTGTSVGIAPSVEGTQVRLVLRRSDGGIREMRTVPQNRNPQFGGFTSGSGQLVWYESTIEPDGTGQTWLWRVDPQASDPPVSLTADTGDAVFFNSQYDLVIAEAPSTGPPSAARRPALPRSAR